MIKGRMRLGDLLIETGLIRPDELEEALLRQARTGERLGKTLIQLGFITEDSMIEVLEFQLGVPRVDLQNISIPREIIAVLPAALAERYSMIPVRKTGEKLLLAMVDPTNFFAVDDAHMASGMEIEPAIASEREILNSIQQFYGINEVMEKAVSKLRQEETANDPGFDTVEDAPVISIVNSLISQAVRDRASDIHIEPRDKEMRVRCRIDGVLRETAVFPGYTHATIVSRIKIMSEMDIAEKRQPQDGRMKVQEDGREIDIRVSTLPTIAGEKVVMRILDQKAALLDITGLGFAVDNLTRYRQLYSQAYGMILVTGPTGSGKSTTLYSTLHELNQPDKNIITVENPVEYCLDGINQVQVNPRAGLTFASGLRAILRQDPNIVMVGEIRDTETADIAIRAGLTGHLVLSTLHTNDAPGAVTRLLDMGVEPFLAASSLLGVVAQRLVRVICPACKESYIPTGDSPERLFVGIQPEEPVTLYHGTGCPQCKHTGYYGRMAIQEVMLVSNRVRDAIHASAAASFIGQIAEAEGMVTMRQDGVEKALAGLTTVQEIMRVAYSGL